METILEFLIHEGAQLGAVGVLIFLCVLAVIKERKEKNCFAKKLGEIQEKRVDDAKDITVKIGDVLEALKDNIKDLAFEIKSLRQNLRRD